MMRLWLVALIAGLSLTGIASAQSTDQRAYPQLINALQAQIAYFEALGRIKDEDARKLAEWWAQYVKGVGEK